MPLADVSRCNRVFVIGGYSWRQAGGPPGFRQRYSQSRGKCEGGAEAAGTEGRLQRQYSRGDRLRLFYAPKLDERRHKQTLRDAEPGAALNSAAPCIRGFLVALTQEISDSKRVIGAKLQPVEGAQTKGALRPINGALSLTAISQGKPAQKNV